MKVAVDANVPVRALVRDHRAQAASTTKLLTAAELIAIALPCLCELVRVLREVYRFQPAAAAIRSLLAAANFEMNRPAVAAGPVMLHGSGDFADSVIAFEGHWLSGETFVSFDKNAIALPKPQGQSARLL